MKKEADLVKGHRQRLKERFLNSPEGLLDYEILELILFNAIPRRDVRDMAKILIKEYKNFAKVVDFDPTKYKDMEEKFSKSVLFQFALIKEVIKRILKEKLSDNIVLSSWNSLYDYLQATMGHQNVENFRVLYLNTKNHLIHDDVQDYGTIDQTSVYPREILKKAIFYDAASIILAHNHPSGVPTPSKADILITNKIIEACKSIDVAVHDHVIVAGNNVFSFKSHNLI